MRFRFLAVTVVLLLLCAVPGYSQTFTGLLDGYYSYNNNTPDLGGTRFNNYRAFDTRDQAFSFNYGEIAVDYKPMDVGLRVDIGFGDTADAVHASEPAGQDLWRYIQQAYITGTAGNFTIDFGKWVTPIGAEVIETKDNWNYSRGLLFTLGIPFYHFGAKGTYAVSDRVSVAGYVVNGWNNVSDPNTAKSVGFVGLFRPTENLSLTANYLFGKELTALEDPDTDEYRHVFDGIVSYMAVPDRLWLMANYDYGMDRDGATGQRVVWQGIAAYAKVQASNGVAFSGRYEFYNDRNGFTVDGAYEGVGVPQDLQSFTATAQFPWQGVVLWTEYRRDWSDVDAFNRTENGVQSLVDDQNTFALGLTYSFTREVR
jgi:hypothetical protein